MQPYLDYADQRYYTSALGRFMTTDPTFASANIANPATWNRYGYVMGDPTNSADPTGLCTIDGLYYVDGVPPCPNDTSVTVTASPPSIFPPGGFPTFIFALPDYTWVVATQITNGLPTAPDPATVRFNLCFQVADQYFGDEKKAADSFIANFGSVGGSLTSGGLIGGLIGALRGVNASPTFVELFGDVALTAIERTLIGAVTGAVIGVASAALRVPFVQLFRGLLTTIVNSILDSEEAQAIDLCYSNLSQ